MPTEQDFENAFAEMEAETSAGVTPSEPNGNTNETANNAGNAANVGNETSSAGESTASVNANEDGRQPGEGNADNASNAGNAGDGKSAAGTEDGKQLNRQSMNDHNAQRRIRKRERQAARIAELEAQLAEYQKLDEETKKNPAVQDAAVRLENRIADARDDYNEEAYEAFADRICNVFGDEKGQQALTLIDRYAKYVNKNEPELRQMAQRPVLGDLLLVEWCTRMNSRSQREQYMSLTRYEKNQYLANLYNTIYRKVMEKRNVQNGNQGATQTTQNSMQSQQPQQPTSVNVPVPASGREGIPDGSDNSFNEAWQQVLNEHKRNKNL